MEAIAKSFIINISTITTSLTYYISSKLPKGIYMFIVSLIPIIFIFTILPLRCPSVFTTAIVFSFITFFFNNQLGSASYLFKLIPSTLANYKWAPLAARLESSFVSGLMHKLLVYHLLREKPTWEMTSFYVLYGICFGVEMVVKRVVCGGRWRFPAFLATILTVWFVVAAAELLLLGINGVWPPPT